MRTNLMVLDIPSTGAEGACQIGFRDMEGLCHLGGSGTPRPRSRRSTTHRHPPEVVPDVVPCASRIFKVFYKAFFATFGGVLIRKTVEKVLKMSTWGSLYACNRHVTVIKTAPARRHQPARPDERDRGRRTARRDRDGTGTTDWPGVSRGEGTRVRGRRSSN